MYFIKKKSNIQSSCNQGTRDVFLVVKAAYPDSTPRLVTGARIFLDLLQDLTTFACRQRDVCGDFVKSRDVPTQSFGGAHRGRVYVRVFIEMSMRAC